MEGIEEIILVFVVATFSYSAETDELKKKKKKSGLDITMAYSFAKKEEHTKLVFL